MGTLEGGIVHDIFTSLEIFREESEEDFILFRIPVDEPWKTLAYFPLGGWNGCPEILEMMAAAKYWYKKYRAIPAVFGKDSLEFVVKKEIRLERDAGIWQRSILHFQKTHHI